MLQAIFTQKKKRREKARAKFENGVLAITMPKAARMKAKEIMPE
ncbi:MAG: Hsp20/alpha crystallin family protein [Nanoarchaeota archaeon]|nr:Hsp20/alpha crystallin family protein [Nanoarchaeota archaeon]